ncbi:DUF3841 domain-containing protein [Acidaminobacter sp. JC074]|uniref:DUF3841 domain-containing protein n=1 Tax=Acidaminobacter sp. JC074 TaxID=2530199 RepID=UPI001F1002ED|nr:DUF3841 domain-containing protein [Acidaminobacter sp. JC074]MCH4890860.1 DUF3841 domain-containing protein [Acidaminobacter sp. JC074]
MKVYSSQRQLVIDGLNEADYFVKKTYITKKYGQVSHIMLHAYDWFIKQMGHMYKPDHAEYPVWHALDSAYLTQGPDASVLELEIPESDLILFDNHGFERILQMNYIGIDPDDEEAFDESLRKKGISCGSDVFLKPHYPLEKKKILSSWPRVFDISSTSVVRAATWTIKPDWIINVRSFDESSRNMD